MELRKIGKIIKIVVERMFNKDIDLLEDEIAKKEETDFAKELLNMIKTKSRSDLIICYCKNDKNRVDGIL